VLPVLSMGDIYSRMCILRSEQAVSSAAFPVHYIYIFKQLDRLELMTLYTVVDR
jgi:hypothetical protein